MQPGAQRRETLAPGPREEERLRYGDTGGGRRDATRPDTVEETTNEGAPLPPLQQSNTETAPRGTERRRERETGRTLRRVQRTGQRCVPRFLRDT